MNFNNNRFNFRAPPSDFNFKDDLSGEHAVNQFLVDYFYKRLKDESKIVDFEVVNDLIQQHAGVDVILKLPRNREINVDEKAAMHHAQTSLDKNAMPTFAFEISYEHNGELKEGWLTSSKYHETDRYLLCWLWVKESSNKYRLKYDDILKIEAMFFDKVDVQKHIVNEVVQSNNNNRFNFIAEQKRRSLEEKLLEVAELYIQEPVGNGKYPKWYLTGSEKLREKPLNILLSRYQLIKLAKSHWMISKDRLERLDKK